MVTKTKSILLDDEEIKEASREYPDSMLNYNPPQLRRIAKAQLKKVVEWGEGRCPHFNPGGETTIYGKRRDCYKCWQALL
ncbi:hypothetical protein LCGC14_1511280, partial [marine sediment metagenome]